MKFFFKKNNKLHRGFTLVEMLVAVSVFTMSILIMIITLAQGISDTSYARQKIIATYLAQEGIEYLRNIRDTSMLYNASSAEAGWADFKDELLTSSCDQEGGCYFNAGGLDFGESSQPILEILPFSACNGVNGACPEFKYNSATKEYNYATGGNSGFWRKIKIVQITVDEIKVSSTVIWTQKSGTHSVTFSETLYNWIK